MSSELPAIRVQGLSKQYQLYDRPIDRLKQFLLPRLRRVVGRRARIYFREFTALNDVSFSVARGEAVGIIGRNGSGKSTLLQLICGTSFPSAGTVATNGRVAALLELGSGFNPEFSGRENVFLNAAMYGLSREDTERRFDAIAAFADIGDHLDQPVKTYSSGMYVRLAFAVIAHVDADILVIDEALAVGDAIFTQRCMRFIRGFLEHGTLLFVSHDTASVQSLCNRALWLERGQIRELDDARTVSENYLRFSLQSLYGDDHNLSDVASSSAEVSDACVATAPTTDALIPVDDASPITTRGPVVDYGSVFCSAQNLEAARGFATEAAIILNVNLQRLTRTGDPEEEALSMPILRGGEWVRMRVEAQARAPLERPILGFLVRDRLGQDLFGENTLVLGQTPPIAAGERFHADFEFVLPMLPNGQYAVMASVADGVLHDNVQHHYLHDALILTVSSSTVRWGLVGVSFKEVRLEVDRA